VSILERLLHRADGADLTVEPMRRRHLPGVMAIEAVSYPRPWSNNVFTGELEMARRGERVYMVARSRNTILGYCGMMLVADDTHLSNIAVHPDHRRDGIATRLLAEMCWESIRRGYQAMTLEVRVSNDPARQLYERFGFVAAGVRQRYYENTDDAVVMWCTEMGADDFRRRLAELCPEARP
jgi:[ribosomal protein S18]-alanine N-acetyltransferase